MYLVAILALGLVVLVFGFLRLKHIRERRELDSYGIEPDALHALLASGQDVLVIDVRQPLDLLAQPEIIPEARRVPPKEAADATSDIPKDRDVVLYCTCVSESTSRWILQTALGMGFTRIRFLKGGLAGWKAKGYAVEPYNDVFHLDTAK